MEGCMSARLTDEQAAALQASGRIRVCWRDDNAKHQIRLTFVNGTGIISVSCSCRKTPGGSFTPLETRTRWEAPEAMAVWRAHVAGAEAAS
jgi:hypothetical protein